MKVSVVVAAYDERDNIEELVRRLDAVLRGMPGVESEMIFVIEGRDGTREIVGDLARELGRIRLLYSEEPSGLGSAFRRGFEAVSPDSDWIVTLDADLNHRPEELPRLLGAAQARGLDVVVGSRFVAGSRNVGIPLWKWVISVLMNRVIGALFDVTVRDKTSGYRVYRAGAIRRILSYRNRDFAFLPEMLIIAAERGLAAGEEPIHFTFRTRGHSKMEIGPTSRSYLSLLRTRFDEWSAAALAILLAGILLRILYAFPPHKYPADADALLAPMRALEILDGDFRVFYSYVRIGALESYLHAAAFMILGVSRAVTALPPIFVAVGSLLAFFFLVRELFGRPAACFALLFFALPSAAFLTWTYMPNGYPETLFFCVATLYFAAQLRRGPSLWSAAALGLAAGLGFWNSLQTLTCTIPSILWLLVTRRELLRRPRLLLAGAAAFLAGAVPWILYNIRHRLPSVRENFAVQAAGGGSKLLSNALNFVTYEVPALLLNRDPAMEAPLEPLESALRPGVAVILLAAASLFAVMPLRRPRQGSPDPPFPRASFGLLWLVAATVAALYVGSAAGGVRGLTVRYVLPLFMVAAAALGLLVSLAWSRRRLLACVIALAVVAFYFSGWILPGTKPRKRLEDLARHDAEAIPVLQAHHLRWVCGNYWDVYPFIFLTQRRVLGLPYQGGWDHHEYSRKLPPQPVPWGLLGRDAALLQRWAARAGLTGRMVAAGEGFHLYLPAPETRDSQPPRALLARLQAAAPAE
jgi:dolichol-phosphate mannosyltransferase